MSDDFVNAYIATGASQVLTFVSYRDASQLKVLQPNKEAIVIIQIQSTV